MARVIDLFPEICKCCCGLSRIDGLHLTARVFEVGYRLGEGNQRLNLRKLLRLNVHLSQLVFEMILEQQIINLAFLAHRIKVQLLKLRQPIRIELSEACLPSRGDRSRI